MNAALNSAGVRVAPAGLLRGHVRALPVVVAAVVVTLVLTAVVAASKSAWFLLGAGRGFVSEDYYHVSAFLLLLGTVFGQAVGWAGGSGIGFYVLSRVGFAATWTTARVAMSLVYLGLAGLPLSVYHALYGQWLLGIPRLGLEQRLATGHPDAYWLLITLHPAVDLSLIPLGVVVLGILWGFGERLRQQMGLQLLFWLALLGTSLAVALSLGIHSTLVHIRL
jgi:hypothetical protein